MPYADVRGYLSALEKQGELVHVGIDVDLKFEIGAICRRALDSHAPALWFDRVKDHTVPLVTNTLATRERIALALETTVGEIHKVWRRKGAHPIPPVKASPTDVLCKDTIVTGDDVDLPQLFPTPVWNELDGGPFITLALWFSSDLDSGWRNIGIYRAQVHSRNTIGLLAPPFKHVRQQAKPLLDAGKPFPVALVIGVDPVISLSAAANLPAGEEELALAGAVRGEPVPVIPCETIPVEVPARAEFVLEGEILPGVTQDEGPFGEVTGYYGLRMPQPVVQIKAVTHRTDPIHVAAYTGRPPSENAIMVAIQIESELLRTLRLPGIQKVHVTEGGCGSFNCVISIEKRFEGYGKTVGLSVLGSWAARPIKNLIIVDDDIDPYDWNQVEWALATRFQPARDVEIIKAIVGHGLDPSIDEIEKQRRTSITSKLLIDATRYDAANYEAECFPPPDVARRVQEEWDKYGIPPGQ